LSGLILIEPLNKDLSVSDYFDTFFLESFSGSNCVFNKKMNDAFTTEYKTPATLDAYTCTSKSFPHFG
jgi:hypothetical protein